MAAILAQPQRREKPRAALPFHIGALDASLFKARGARYGTITGLKDEVHPPPKA